MASVLRRDGLRAVLGKGGATPLALIAFAMLALALGTPASAQTFVAEWAESDIGRLGPTGLAVDTINGVTFLYVVDQPKGRVVKFNLTAGRREAVFGATGDGNGELNSPYGIAVEPVSHDLYIAERVGNRIHRLTNTGQYVMKWGVGGSAAGEFWAPVGVAADAAGNVYVSEASNHRIQKFRVQQTASGWQAQHVATWGREGSRNGEFNRPFGLTLDRSGVLWVADSFNHRLQKFDTNGNFLGVVGGQGTGPGQFITPTWVNFDATGAYYVAETNSDPFDPRAPDLGHQRIQKFAADGTFLLQWGSLGEAGGQFKLPFNIVVHTDRAYVADYYNSRLQVFSLPPPTTPPTQPPGGSPGAASHFVNLSSRLHTVEGSAMRALIAGFVVTGTAPKPMLIRAVGPGLAAFGVGGALANPKLQIFSGAQVIAESEDWEDTAAMRTTCERVGAFRLTAGSRDAALIVTLPPGAYSAHVAPNGGDGIALVEVYDVETAQTTAQLINLSTRGFVETGDAVLVAGFVVSGTAPKRVLVRGIGPSLVAFGVNGALADATLKLYQGNSLLAQNDNWNTPQPIAGAPAPGSAADVAAAASGVGAFALDAGSKDAALLLTLPPGAYSAVVSGAGALTGAALVEVYEVP